MGRAAAPGFRHPQTLAGPQKIYASCAKIGQADWHRACSFPIGAWRLFRQVKFRFRNRAPRHEREWNLVEPQPGHARRESAVLTNRRAEASWASRCAAYASVAIVLSATPMSSAYAESFVEWSCVGAPYGFYCATQWRTVGDPYIRHVPEATGEAEKARFEARDHRWVARCRPVIERDRYGVARYHYSAAGCEFGVGAD